MRFQLMGLCMLFTKNDAATFAVVVVVVNKIKMP